MFFRQFTKVFAISVSTIALMAMFELPEPISAQSARDSRGSNARSGPATGGVVGTIESMSSSSFMVSTWTDQKVLVNESLSTEYLKGTTPTTTSVLAKGDDVLVLGMVNGRSIAASQVIVRDADKNHPTSFSAYGVIPFQRGAPSAPKQVGQISANYSEGAGMIVSGIMAEKATKAALASYAAGIVDRVVMLSGGEYEVHNIGVNWPHHIFVSPNFEVVGAL
ncbi:DUF5666 domain-containing protein [Edaphobacter albus]|uniref:DUF5666 domain-containing protein n=1 Tax=Edaphobacter sp. 4G125 TaxID=2763071 RepID=UPI001646CC44|nr:DUF5666 domain-containing protein [Edaphobacter sp. 4G125]QNI37986.1 hypothetical protein H7846_06915 [Edaphobacter sp. 4G125]